MSKKVSYDVSYQVCGRAIATVLDYIQTLGQFKSHHLDVVECHFVEKYFNVYT